MVEALAKHPDAEMVAVCDASEHQRRECRALAERNGLDLVFYDDFDRFIEHDMDAVVLANYATEHAPYAVRLLDSGRHVCSEVLACETMAEGVALVEAVERSGKAYTYAENYCYAAGIFEMQRLYQVGALGEFLHGECEYIHDCESIWPLITHGEKDHWRVWTPSTFYCTHSAGPIMSITGLRPTRVTGYETPNVNSRRFGRLGSDGSLLVCQMSNGGIAKFVPWAGYRKGHGANWCAVYGSKGSAEIDRWGGDVHVYTEEKGETETYRPEPPDISELAKSIAGHGGGDFYTMQFFLDAALDRPGKENAIDVYQAVDMTALGILGYRSIWERNIPLEVPDLRDKAVREKYRDDNWCVDPKFAGPGQPDCSTSFGPVEIDESVYEETAEKYRESLPKG